MDADWYWQQTFQDATHFVDVRWVNIWYWPNWRIITNNNNEKVFVFPKQRVFYFLLSYCWKELNSDNYRGSIVDMFHSLFDSWSSVFSLHVFSRGFFILMREEWTSRFNTLNPHSMRSRSSFCQFTLTYTSAPVRACNSQVHLDCLRCDSRTRGLTMKRTCWQRFILKINLVSP